MLALLAVDLLCGFSSLWFRFASAQSPTGKLNGLIAFVTNRNGPPGEIYVMSPDGSNQRDITNSPASETRPAFSPDGRKIAFIRDFKDIMVMNPDGSSQTQILDGASTGFTSISSFPDWSPDNGARNNPGPCAAYTLPSRQIPAWRDNMGKTEISDLGLQIPNAIRFHS